MNLCVASITENSEKLGYILLCSRVGHATFINFLFFRSSLELDCVSRGYILLCSILFLIKKKFQFGMCIHGHCRSGNLRNVLLPMFSLLYRFFNYVPEAISRNFVICRWALPEGFVIVQWSIFIFNFQKHEYVRGFGWPDFAAFPSAHD